MSLTPLDAARSVPLRTLCRRRGRLRSGLGGDKAGWCRHPDQEEPAQDPSMAHGMPPHRSLPRTSPSSSGYDSQPTPSPSPSNPCGSGGTTGNWRAPTSPQSRSGDPGRQRLG